VGPKTNDGEKKSVKEPYTERVQQERHANRKNNHHGDIMEYPVCNRMPLKEQAEPEPRQDTVCHNVNIRRPGTQDDYPRIVPSGEPVKEHADKDCNSSGVNDMFREHGGRKDFRYQNSLLRFLYVFSVHIFCVSPEMNEKNW
jgi:hypothetical protein